MRRDYNIISFFSALRHLCVYEKRIHEYDTQKKVMKENLLINY